jgi:hypothetical protein
VGDGADPPLPGRWPIIDAAANQPDRRDEDVGAQSFGWWKVTDVLGDPVPRKSVVELRADDVALAMATENGAVLGSWPVNQLRFDPYGRHNGFLDLAGQAAWITSVDRRPADELAAFLRERWTPPTAPTQAVDDGPTITRSYPAEGPADASRAFIEDAERLSAGGYRPASQLWADPDRSSATAIRVGGVIVALVSLLFLPAPMFTILLLLFAAVLFYVGGASVGDGTLTVTYERVAEAPAEVRAPSTDPSTLPPADVADGARRRLLELAQLRDEGLITPDEYAAKRAGILAGL